MCVFHFADVFSYDEDDMVEDPNLAQHLAHFGINITQMEKVCDNLCIFSPFFFFFGFGKS